MKQPSHAKQVEALALAAINLLIAKGIINSSIAQIMLGAGRMEELTKILNTKREDAEAKTTETELMEQLTKQADTIKELLEALDAAGKGLLEASQAHLVPGLYPTYEIVKGAISKAKGA